MKSECGKGTYRYVMFSNENDNEISANNKGIQKFACISINSSNSSDIIRLHSYITKQNASSVYVKSAVANLYRNL